jgi:hypothetical protein
MNGDSTVRAEVAKSYRYAGSQPSVQAMRRNGRGYLGRALGRSGTPDWLMQSLRALALVATGLVLGALVLLSVD